MVLGVEMLVFGVRGPWRMLQGIPPFQCALEAGVVHDRLALRRLIDAGDGRQRVFVVGSSRAAAGFWIPPGAPRRSDVVFAKLAHAAIAPFEMRSAVEEILDYHPAAVVWFLSEFDTHRPLHLTPAASFGSLAAIADLVAETGIRFAVTNRVILYRLALVGLLRSYRYRDVLGRAGLDAVRRFPLGPHFPVPEAEPPKPLLRGRPPLPVPGEAIERSTVRSHAGLVGALRSITRGPHARVQMNLLRRAVRVFHAAGVPVIVVEAPVNPEVAVLYDPSTRTEFRDFVHSLVDAYGVRFVPLGETGPFVPDDFGDAVHVKLSGMMKLTVATRHAVEEVLGLEATGRQHGRGS